MCRGEGKAETIMNTGIPDVKNGYIAIANELWEALIAAKLNAREWNLIAVIIRKTYGWQKYEDKISLSQFEKMTGIARNKIGGIINGLIKRNIIHKTIPQKGHTGIPTYSINKFYKQWGQKSRGTPKRGIPQKGEGGDPKKGFSYPPKRGTTKDNIQKTLLQKTKDQIIYSADFLKFWDTYPQKKGKIKAYESFRKATNRTTLDKMLSAIVNQLSEKKYLREKNSFCPDWPNPTTWLNQGRWDDEASIETQQKTGRITFDENNIPHLT